MISRYLTINSIDRNSGNPSNFQINIHNGLSYKTCRLVMAQIPNTYYNITDYNNGILINSVLKKLTPGNYNLDEFFQAFINIDSSIQSISYDDTICKIIITCTSSTNISFPTNGSINFVIGFDKNYNSSAITHTSVNPPSLAKHVLYIDIDQLSSNHTSSFINSTSNVFEVPNNVNKNEIIFYNEKTNFRQSVNCKSNSEIIYNLSVKIKDQFNQIVTGLSDFSLILAFY